jgi:ApaG protein
MYEQITRGIRVTAIPRFLDHESDPTEGKFFWAYTITLENQGADTVQLLNRHWHITDEVGRSREVRGPGVVGKTPILRPGEHFQYTSGVPLATPSGIMMGDYEMALESGETFQVAVPAFSLESPFGTSRPN